MATALCGMLTGGVTLLHVGAAERALPLRNTWPGCPGVPESKPERVTKRLLPSPGRNARPVTKRLGTPLDGSRSVQLAPPSLVTRSCPLAVPKAYVAHVGSEGAKATAVMALPISGPLEDQEGVPAAKKFALFQRLSVPAIMAPSPLGHLASRPMKGTPVFS